MKKHLLFCLIAALLPMLCLSQSSKKGKTPSVHAALHLNYYPPLKPYWFSSDYWAGGNDLVLKFLTPRSGTFTIENGDTLLLERLSTYRFPSQVMGLGASVQVRAQGGAFHEFSLTRLSFYKSSHVLTFIHHTIDGRQTVSQLGYEDKAAVIALRYEYGKLFGDVKNKFRFGLSGGFEPSFYRVKRASLSLHEYPASASILAFDFSVIPTFSFALSKKILLDFKAIPSALIADVGKVRENNPTLPIVEQGGSRDYKMPDLSLAFSVALRYTVKESKRRKKG